MQSGACMHDRPLQVHQQLHADLHRSRRRRVFITKPLQALNNGPVRGKKEKEKKQANVYGRNAKVHVWLGLLTGFTHIDVAGSGRSCTIRYSKGTQVRVAPVGSKHPDKKKGCPLLPCPWSKCRDISTLPDAGTTRIVLDQQEFLWLFPYTYSTWSTIDHKSPLSVPVHILVRGHTVAQRPFQ